MGTLSLVGDGGLRRGGSSRSASNEKLRFAHGYPGVARGHVSIRQPPNTIDKAAEIASRFLQQTLHLQLTEENFFTETCVFDV